MGNKIAYHLMFKAKNIISKIVSQIKGLRLLGIFLRVGLMFCEVLLVESREVVNIISQMATPVDEGLNVSLEVAPIKELQLIWRYP